MRAAPHFRALLAAIALASSATVAGDARAQGSDQGQAAVPDPSKLPVRGPTTFTWDKTLLRASFKYRDVVDKKVTDRLGSGLNNVIAMRAYVFEDGRTEPIALAARTCSVVYDLWDEVYRVKITDSAGERNLLVINAEGVVRRCMEVQDFPIVVRPLLKKAKPYFLGVIVEVNPISDATLQQIRQWVSRPTGATGLTAGDALFGSFVGLFVRQIGTADRTLPFRTQPFIP